MSEPERWDSMLSLSTPAHHDKAVADAISIYLHDQGSIYANISVKWLATFFYFASTFSIS